MAKLNERGHEILDNTPVAVPVGFKKPPTLHEQIQRLVRSELSRQADLQGKETFDEADDFDIGDDFDPTSPYEEHFDHEVNLKEAKEYTKKKITEQKAQKKKARFEEEQPTEKPAKEKPSTPST